MKNNNDINDICKAIQFGLNAHEGQKRKYGDKSVYFSHCLKVYFILDQLTDERDILIAALLHDTIEDTSVTFDEISSLFGPNVAKIVSEVSKDENKNFKITCREAVMVKLADILHNLSDCPDENYIKKQIRFIGGEPK